MLQNLSIFVIKQEIYLPDFTKLAMVLKYCKFQLILYTSSILATSDFRQEMIIFIVASLFIYAQRWLQHILPYKNFSSYENNYLIRS